MNKCVYCLPIDDVVAPSINLLNASGNFAYDQV
jgi:hypothetical protein